MLRAFIAALALWVITAPARAEVTAANPDAFTVRETLSISAAPETVWRGLARIGDWWESSHTYSGDARNLSIALDAGGCWCERWGRARVQHMRVLYVDPAKALRLEGALGPLQTMGVYGVMVIALEAADGGTLLTVDYRVTGASDSQLDAIATPVDGVLTAQFERLKRLAETGRAE